MSSYEQRMGRYTRLLGDATVAALDLAPGARVLDVGCGAGALTVPLVRALGAEHVAAIDPAGEDLGECARRVPGADLREGVAEDLPWPAGTFDAVLAQCVVGLLPDAGAALAEMRRVCRPGGIVVGSVWDFGGGMTLLREFWAAARTVDSAAAGHDQSRTQRYTTEPELNALFEDADLDAVSTRALVVEAEYRDVDDLWDPLAEPDGAPGRYLTTLDEDRRQRVRRALLGALGDPQGPFRLSARAWCAIGRVPK